MKIIVKIAKAELRTLFYSPIAWITLGAFFILCTFQFANPLVDMAKEQELMILNNPGWTGFKGPLTVNLFIASIKNMLQFLFLFIPLITMD